MDPAMICCPNLACPARGPTDQGNMRMHSRQDRRFLCTACYQTFSATKSTAFYRLRTSAETVRLGVTLLAHGCPRHAIVVAFGSDERTVAGWLRRAGGHGQAVQEHLVEPPRALGQVQADESRVKKQGGVVWMALAMRVQTRWWLAGEGSEQRDMPLLRQLIERVRAGALQRPLLFGMEGRCSYVRAMRETFREPGRTGAQGRPRWRPWRTLCMAPVGKRYAQRRVVAIERRIVAGPPARVETLRRRSPGAGVINTAAIARLHATCRERLASLTRRGRALARHPLTVQHGMDLMGTVYHFCPPHASLTHGSAKTTPAMAAGITEHGWTVQELLSLPVPPPRWTPPARRGRPSRALKRLIEQWCS